MRYYLHFLLSHTIFVPLWVGLFLKGSYTFLLLGYVFIYLVLLDLIFGKEKYFSLKSEIQYTESKQYKLILYCWSFIHIFNVLITLYLIHLNLFSIFETIGIIFSLGAMCSQSVGVSHELCHKNKKLDKILAKIMLFFVFYNHFEIEHKIGHHINVATELDPATAKFGQSFYNFLPQTVFGGIKNAYIIDAKKNGYGVYNRIVKYFFLYIVWMTFLFLWSPLTCLFLFSTSIIAIILLESINYFEHYGLERKKLENGTYESVKFHHSWDNDSCISNWLLFRIGRHADHHLFPYKEYQYLTPIDRAGQLPFGYLLMTIISLVPFLFFDIMNPRVIAIKKKYDQLNNYSSI